jgi:hypothetical protein
MTVTLILVSCYVEGAEKGKYAVYRLRNIVYPWYHQYKPRQKVTGQDYSWAHFMI